MPSETGVLDLLGIGFGPSNLSLAAAFEDERERTGCRALSQLFLERRHEYAWHPGMIWPGTDMQVSCLKDLATLRNPRSRFTYLNFLHTRGRLDEFVNLSTTRPSRHEFNEYLCWAAEQLGEVVRFGCEVLAVEPGEADAAGSIRTIRVTTRDVKDGQRQVLQARNLVLASGLVPRLPSGVECSGEGRIVHSVGFIPAFPERFDDTQAAWSFVVVGDGQSAAELFEYLITRYPHANIRAAIERVAYRPADDSPFVNETFFPRSVDFFYELDEEQRRKILDSVYNTNYSVVNLELIERLYRRLYEERGLGRRSLEVVPFTRLGTAREDGQGVTLGMHKLIEDRDEKWQADALVLGTGYGAPNPHPLLSGLEEHLQRDEHGRHQVTRGYRIESRAGFAPGVFLQGFCQTTHGYNDPLLSIAAVRAGDIARVLATRVAEQRGA